MKKTLLTLAIAITGYCSHAQTNTFPSSGNVGIGTTSPGTNKLAVFGDSGANAGYFVGANSSSNSYGLFVQAGTSYSDVAMQVVNRSLGLPYFMVRGDGNVGIGTTNPGTTLAVAGNSSSNVRSFALSNSNTTNGAGTSIYMGFQADSGDPYGIRLFQQGSPTGTRSGIFDIQRHGGTSGDSDWISSLFIDYNGSVGIGTTNPPEKLTLRDPGIPYDSNSGIMKIRFDSGAGGGGIGFEKETFNTGGLRFYTQYGYNSTLEKMRITSNGDVGIGTTSPDAKLAVNGTIHTKEVKVDLTGWPDYVFKPKYKLPSLAEVKTYIDQNQHLPEMPSEHEVAKDGINLGEMNKLLTKKVEELTLYMIEKDKQLTDQQIINQQQAVRFSSQQEQIDLLKQQLKSLLNKSTN